MIYTYDQLYDMATAWVAENVGGNSPGWDRLHAWKLEQLCKEYGVYE